MKCNIWKFTVESEFEFYKNIKNQIHVRHLLEDVSDESLTKLIPIWSRQISKELSYHSKLNKFQIGVIWRRFCESKQNINNLRNECCRLGLQLPRHFFPNMYEVRDRKSGLTLAERWKQPETFEKLILYLKKCKLAVNPKNLRHNMKFITGQFPVNTYNPHVAKCICDHYGLKVVLDPCAGWGTRMMGVCANKERRYIAFEPCTKTFENLQRMANELQIANRVNMYHTGSEHVLDYYSPGSADGIITSPPYFDQEIYSDEKTQSTSGMATYGEWETKWLVPMMKKCLSIVKDGGYSFWNVTRYKALEQSVIRVHEECNFERIDDVVFRNPLHPGAKVRIKENYNFDITLGFRKRTKKSPNLSDGGF